MHSTDSSGSGDKVDQGAQYRGAACCYRNFSHNLYHSSYPFHRRRERERQKANELTHPSKTVQHAWLPFCHHFVEILVTTSIIITIVCGNCANMYVCGGSVPMFGRGEGLPDVFFVRALRRTCQRSRCDEGGANAPQKNNSS